MATIPAFGARNLQATNYYPVKADGNAANTGNLGNLGSTPATQKASGVSAAPLLSSNGLDLQKRVASLGNATVDFAQDFVSSFTQALFGDAAKGATIDFDSASLETSSSFALGVQQSSGPNGTRSLAGFSLSDSSHFIGKGTITTADGRKFDFEVEVKYDYQLDAAASQSTEKLAAPQQTDKPASNQVANSKDLPTVQLPNIDFAGTLADLFQLIGRDLNSALSAGGNDQQGGSNADSIDRNTLRGLSLRLLNLVDSRDTNTYAPPSAAEQAKSAAAYGEQAPAAPGTATEPPAPAAAPIAAATAPAADPAQAATDTPAASDAATRAGAAG
ncbi:MAG: hypothetical protein ABW202_18565 [Duganella sp.]